MKGKVLILFVLFSLIVKSQEPVHTVYNVENGLISNTVYKILQDSKGYMWFCTDKGVSRFDGKSFKNFMNSKKLKNEPIFNITENEKGDVIFGSYEPSIFIVRGKKMLPYIFNDSIKRYTRDNRVISSIKFEKDILELGFQYDGKIVISKTGKVKVFDSIKGKCVEVRAEQTFTYSNGTKAGVVSRPLINVMNQNNCYHILEDKVFSPGNRGPSLYSCYADSNTYFISNHDFLVKYSIDGNYEYRKMDNVIDCIKFINGKLHVGLIGGGLNIINQNLQTVNHILGETSVTDVEYNRNTGYWISTLNEGVINIPSLDLLWLTSKDMDQHIYQLEFAGDSIFYSTTSGDIFLSVFKQGKTKTSCLARFNGNRKDLDLSIGKSKSGIIAELDPKHYTFLSNDIEVIQTTSTVGTPKVITSSNKFQFLIGTQSRIYEKEMNKNDLVEIPLSIESNKQINKINVNDFHQDQFGTVWVASSYGLFIVSDSIYKYEYVKESINSITSHKGQLFCLTTQNEIIVVDSSNEKVNSFTLPFRDLDKIWNVDERLFVANNRKIFELSMSEGDFQYKLYFNLPSGFLLNDVSPIQDSLLIIGTNRGVLVCNPAKAVKYDSKPFIDFIILNGSDTLFGVPESIKYQPESIQFCINDFTIDELNNGFEYKFKNEDRWMICQNEKLLIRNPDIGKLQVYFRKRNDQNSQNYLLAGIEIRPSIEYKSIFLIFIIITTFLLFSSMRLSNSFNKIKIVLSSNKPEEINLLKLKLMFARFNPHFTFNMLNSLQSMINKNEYMPAMDMTNKFSKLLRKVLSSSKDGFIFFEEEVEFIKRYLELEKVRFGNRITYSLEVSARTKQQNILVPSMITQPFIENSIKHGLRENSLGMSIDISITEEDENLIFIILDDGIGFSTSLKEKIDSKDTHESEGIKLVYERLQIVNQGRNKHFFTIEDRMDSKGNVNGTKVLFLLPKRQSNEENKSANN